MTIKKLSTLHIIIIVLATILLYIGLNNNTANDSKAFVKKDKRVTEKVTDTLNEFKTTNDTTIYILTWVDLENINYIEKSNVVYGTLFYPDLTENLRNHKGKKIQLSGYVLPMDDESYVLSKNVMAACFFCGVGGAETIAGLTFKDKTLHLKTDTYLTIQGIFNYNETDPDDWIYTIDQVVIINKKN